MLNYERSKPLLRILLNNFLFLCAVYKYLFINKTYSPTVEFRMLDHGLFFYIYFQTKSDITLTYTETTKLRNLSSIFCLERFKAALFLNVNLHFHKEVTTKSQVINFKMKSHRNGENLFCASQPIRLEEPLL